MAEVWRVPGRTRPLMMVCFGTRPEAIKLAPVIIALRGDERFDVVVVTSGQHREMLDQSLAAFGIVPDVNLDLMKPEQDLAQLAAAAVAGLAAVMADRRPDAVLVHGDTTTAICGALAAFYASIPIGHVEAGLRIHDQPGPFPEDAHRRMVSVLGRWHWAPTQRNADALVHEGVPREHVTVTGNTVIDALAATAQRPLTDEQAATLPERRAAKRILVTLHRRETQGAAQRRLCRMMARLAARRDVELLFPVHLSRAVRRSVEPELRGVEHVHLLEPLDYPTFVHAMRSSDLILTDSGGIQEEAPHFGVPVLVMREVTERPEAVEAGCARVVGTRPAQVEAAIDRVLDDEAEYRAMAHAANPYGDGHAARRIVADLARDLASAGPSTIVAA